MCVCVFVLFPFHLTLTYSSLSPFIPNVEEAKTESGKQIVVYSCGNNHEESWAVPSVIRFKQENWLKIKSMPWPAEMAFLHRHRGHPYLGPLSIRHVST